MSAPRPFEARIDPEGVVYLSGELDMAVADSFYQGLVSSLDGQRPVLDLSELAFLDSSGIRAIVQLAQACGQAVTLRSPRPNVRRVLEVSGVDKLPGIQIEA